MQLVEEATWIPSLDVAWRVGFDGMSLVLSLLTVLLCAIVHVAMIVQMLQTHLVAGRFQSERTSADIVERRPPKIVPEYHPTQLVPEEDRPRQDFEKPIPTESPEPTPEPERIVRQSTEQVEAPAQPQPVPVPEQLRTTEPNVVNRQVPNEARIPEPTSSGRARVLDEEILM
jgi:outer membrane biosynthesis protein TonB